MNNRKKSNRTRILEFMFRHAPVSRATIAENTDITPATVTTTTSSLISENVIFSLGETEHSTETTPGRKRILLDLNPNYKYGIGIEFTEKHITFCITNLKGQIIDHITLNTTNEEITHITEYIAYHIENLMTRNQDIASQIIGIGIAVPGKLNNTKTEFLSDYQVWHSFNLQKLKDQFDLPIILENNVRSMAYGQYLFKPKSYPENFAFFHIGMGMHCASIVNGELFKENNYIAGEIGHTIVQVDGRRCECGKYGCLQTYASERWLLQATKLLYQNDCSAILKSLVNSEDSITTQHILTAYTLGDPIINQYISEALKYLSITVSNIYIILHPSKVFLHGELFHNEEICKELLSQINTQLAFLGNNYSNSIEIVPYSSLNGAIGASALAINTYFINGESSL